MNFQAKIVDARDICLFFFGLLRKNTHFAQKPRY